MWWCLVTVTTVGSRSLLEAALLMAPQLATPCLLELPRLALGWRSAPKERLCRPEPRAFSEGPGHGQPPRPGAADAAACTTQLMIQMHT